MTLPCYLTFVEAGTHVLLFFLFSTLNFINLQVIEANLNGDLNLKIETELVCVTTHFKDLGNPLLCEFSYGLYFDSKELFEYILSSFNENVEIWFSLFHT